MLGQWIISNVNIVRNGIQNPILELLLLHQLRFFVDESADFVII